MDDPSPTDPSPTLPSPVVHRRPGFAAWALLLAICAAVAAMDFTLARRSNDFDVWGNWSGPRPPIEVHSEDDPYNLLTRGLEKGHLYLDKKVPLGLELLPDPYDSGANNRFRDKDGVFDLSYYDGHLYLYFGITPALTAYLPWHLLARHFHSDSYLSEWLSVAGFSITGWIASATLLLSLWRRKFPGVGVGYVAAGLVILGTATTVPLLDARPRFWEVPVSCSYAFLMLAVASAWFACRRGRAQAAWLAFAGLAAGLAVGARPNVLPSALGIAAAAALGAALADPDPLRTRSSALTRSFTAAFLPLVAVGIGLAVYNLERFGNPLQFGQHYQLASDNVHGRPTFSIAFIRDNLGLYGFSALRWGPHFPFVWTPDTSTISPAHGTVEFVVGILPNLPVLLLALAAPLAWWGRTDADTRLLAGCGAGLAFLFLVQATVLGLFYGICSRYEVDFLPFLALLACLGLLGLAQTLPANRPRIRRAAVAGMTLLCAYSACTSVCAAVAWGEFNRWWNVSQILVNGPYPASAIPICRQAIRVTNGWHGYTELGTAELRSGHLAEAIEDLTRGINQDPRDWIGRVELGIALDGTGRTIEALYTFREAQRLAPGFVPTEFNLGRELLKMHRLEDAAEHLTEAVRRDPENVSAHQILGQVYLLEGRTAAGMDQLRLVLDLAPNSPEAEDEFGLAVLQAGFNREAIDHFQAALRLKPDFKRALDHLALARGGSQAPK